MHLRSQIRNFLAEFAGKFSQPRILVHQFQKLRRLLGGQRELRRILVGQFLPVLGVSLGMDFVPIRLPRLREQDQRRGVGGLKTKRQIQQNEGIEIKSPKTRDIQPNPDRDDHRLRDQENGCPEEPGKGLRLQREPVIPKNGREMNMRHMEPEMVSVVAGFCSCRC